MKKTQHGQHPTFTPLLCFFLFGRRSPQSIQASGIHPCRDSTFCSLGEDANKGQEILTPEIRSNKHQKNPKNWRTFSFRRWWGWLKKT